MVWIWEHHRVPGGTIIYTQLAACSNILLLIVVLCCFGDHVGVLRMMIYTQLGGCTNILLLIVVLGPVCDTANGDADCFADGNDHT